MKSRLILISLIGAVSIVFASERTRLVVMADMGCEPDEMQQMVHMLMCSNEFEPELLMAVTGKYIHPGMKDEYRQVTHPELFHEIIDAYAEVYENLQQHSDCWHTPDYLRTIVCSGQPEYGIAGVGEGKSSEGSKRLVEVFERDDPRPIWIAVNAGSSTLAQSLHDYAQTHSKEELQAVVKKLRVFENGAQDNAGAFICKTYPEIHWIRSNYQTYAYGGPGSPRGTDISTIGPQFWGDYAYTARGQHDWLQEHVIKNHGPLGAVYPERSFGKRVGFMEGGGTIPWIGLVNRGLFSTEHPFWGGWGGRYTSEKVKDVMSRHESVSVDDEMQTPYFMYSDAQDHWMNPPDGKTWTRTLGDIEAMAHLVNYYAEKLRAADLKESNPAAAVEHLKTASNHWKNYAEIGSRQYHPQLLSKGGVADWQDGYENALKDISSMGEK
ncbi:DUF1593 domain-containing protein [Pontiellaceae bacterium B1224]|nr:DUF1593 domain-containing protein [Pontiellaceae bacterium B1224]